MLCLGISCKDKVSEAFGVSQSTHGHKFGGPKYGFPASAAKWGVKVVWAAEPCGADSQPTFGTFSRWFIRHTPKYLR